LDSLFTSTFVSIFFSLVSHERFFFSLGRKFGGRWPPGPGFFSEAIFGLSCYPPPESVSLPPCDRWFRSLFFLDLFRFTLFSPIF